MKFSDIQIVNYKGFEDSGLIDLHPHINVLVGQNSAGKSAFLESFEFTRGAVSNSPHRSTNNDSSGGTSIFRFGFVEHGPALARFALATGNQINFRIPQNIPEPAQIIEKIKRDTLTARTVWTPNNGGFNETTVIAGGITLPPEPGGGYALQPNATRNDFILQGTSNNGNMGPILWENAKSKLFTFKPERFRVGRCSLSNPRALDPTASNLPVCLSMLNGNRDRFQEYVELVRQVLPQVKNVAARPDMGGGGDVEILIYNVKTNNPNLGIPLNDCGTGVAQVLAMLYVILTFDNAVIVIDEPHTFLHPAATKSLMRILRQNRNFQFIVSTHSAEVISALAPERVLDVRWDEAKECSTVVSRQAKSIATRRSLLANLGISFADIFGSDKVIWTEGATEAECFELLLDAADDIRPQALTFLAMPFASKADQKDKSDVTDFFAVLTKASEGAVLWPTSTWFSFDPERRKPDQLTEIEKLSGNRTTFLPRRTYENYLLHAKALAALLTKLDKDGSHTEQSVSDWIAANKEAHRKGAAAEADFDVEGDAASLLKAMFSALSETRVQYDKVDHGAWLTEWLIKNDKPFLADLSQYVAGLAKSVDKT
jgi:hypothetical protein